MSVKGRPKKPLSPAQRRVYALATIAERSRLLRLWRQRDWVAARRKENPEKYLAAVRTYRRKRSKEGWYKRGGPWYRQPGSSAKRRAYWKNYNATRRKKANV